MKIVSFFLFQVRDYFRPFEPSTLRQAQGPQVQGPQTQGPQAYG